MPSGAGGDTAAAGFDTLLGLQAALRGIGQEETKKIEIEIAEALETNLEAAKQLLKLRELGMEQQLILLKNRRNSQKKTVLFKEKFKNCLIKL